jgi:hypothetical protein
MIYLKLTMFLALAMVYPALGIAQSPNASYACNLAKVGVRSEKTGSVLVRSGAGGSFRRTGKLRSGQDVYICDELGEWYKIYYSAPDGPCGSESEKGLDSEKAKGCQSGWVEKKWIDVISG